MESLKNNLSKRERPRWYEAQSKKIIWKVYNFLKTNKKEYNIKNVAKTAAMATGVAERTIERIVKQGREFSEEDANCSFLPPNKKYLKRKTSAPAASFLEEVIRRKLYSFYEEHDRQPVLKELHKEFLQDETLDFKAGLTTFKKIVYRLGFRWRKTLDNRRILIESNDIRNLRVNYIKKILNYRMTGRPIIYTDESYMHSSNDITSYGWSNDSGADGKRFYTSVLKGHRLVIAHAGGEDGFVQNGLLIFKSGQKTGEYQDDMNVINYEKWITTQLIPNLPKNSVVVVGNASYHNAKIEQYPTNNSKKEEIIHWLNAKGIQFNLNSNKIELYNLVKIHKPLNLNYKIDNIFSDHGHTVCRLPPHHPDLNPIEKIFGIVKNSVAVHNIPCKLNNLENLTREKFSEITKEIWQNTCQNIKEVEEFYLNQEHIIDNFSDQFIIIDNTSDDEILSDDE